MPRVGAPVKGLGGEVANAANINAKVQKDLTTGAVSTFNFWYKAVRGFQRRFINGVIRGEAATAAQAEENPCSSPEFGHREGLGKRCFS